MQADLQKGFLEKATLRFEAGEADRLEKTLAENQHLQALRAIEIAQRELRTAFKELQTTAFLSEDFYYVQISP